jgi:hypothetical protein
LALDHLLGIGQVRLSLEAAAQSAPGKRLGFSLVEWLPGERVRFRVAVEETGQRKVLVSIIPDGAAIVKLGSHRHYSFIEMDRGTEPLRTITGKAKAYRAYWKSGGFAADFSVPAGMGFRVLFIAPSKRRAETILKAVQGVPEPRQLFRVAMEEDVTPDRVTGTVWIDGASGKLVSPFRD